MRLKVWLRTPEALQLLRRKYGKRKNDKHKVGSARGPDHHACRSVAFAGPSAVGNGETWRSGGNLQRRSLYRRREGILQGAGCHYGYHQLRLGGKTSSRAGCGRAGSFGWVRERGTF